MAQFTLSTDALQSISAQIPSLQMLLDRVKSNDIWRRIFDQYGLSVVDHVLESTYLEYMVSGLQHGCTPGRVSTYLYPCACDIIADIYTLLK